MKFRYIKYVSIYFKIDIYENKEFCLTMNA